MPTYPSVCKQLHDELFKGMSLCMRKSIIWGSDQVLQKPLVQLQKMSRSSKFLIQGEEKLHNPSSENKGADHPLQLL